MALRQTISDEQRRLLRILGLMPLASVSNLAPVLDMDESRVRRMLNRLRQGEWAASVRRGMTERQQQRWFLTRRAVDLLYVNDHAHPTPREEARAAALVESGRDPGAVAELGRRFSLDHGHPLHREGREGSPFVSAVSEVDPPDGDGHEHPPWTATARGVQTALRRLAMLEPIYRLAPDLLSGGRARWSADASGVDLLMTDFRLLRHGGFYHAVARYGEQVWAPFIHAGLHATERALRRKRDHRFWGVSFYSHREGGLQRIENRIFEARPVATAEPSVQVVVCADAWALDLARRTLAETVVGDPTPTLYHVAGGLGEEGWHGDPVELRPSRDLVSDPPGHPSIGRPEAMPDWLAAHPDVAVIDGRVSYRLFSVIVQFPAMRASWLKRVIGGSQREVNDRLGRFVRAGLVAVYDRRYYLAELGMRRAANLSRVLPGMVRRRHGAYLDRWYRDHERTHNDGVNLLVVGFAEERVSVVAGWRGEINVPDVTQVRPDLLAPVEEGPFGPGAYCLEFERSAVSPREVVNKLGPYRRVREAGPAQPLLMVCETAAAMENFRRAGGELPLLLTTFQQALRGPLTGAATVWSRHGEATALHCRRRGMLA